MRKVIWLTGMPGCGKSTTGKLLAGELGVDFFDLDTRIEETEGASVAEIFAKLGEPYFRLMESRAVRAVPETAAVIACGGGAVLNKDNFACMREKGTVVFLDRPVCEIEKCIDWETRPLLAGGRQALYALYEKRIGIYRRRNDITYTVTASPELTAKLLAALLKFMGCADEEDVTV